MKISEQATHTYEVSMIGNYLEFLVNGKKECELRINNHKWQQVKKGDEVIFYPIDKSKKAYKGIVVNRIEYKTFESAISNVGYKNLMPECQSEEETLKRYKAFPGAENISHYGCVCLYFENWIVV